MTSVYTPNPADNALLRAEVRVSAETLVNMVDDKQLNRYVSNQLRQSLADMLLNVGERTNRQTMDGLLVTHEVLVFTPTQFHSIVRAEARRLYERSGPVANTYYHTP